MDDPVNAKDPTGLLAFLLPFAAGMAGATAISATGSYLAAKAADWFGKKTDKDYAPKNGVFHELIEFAQTGPKHGFRSGLGKRAHFAENGLF